MFKRMVLVVLVMVTATLAHHVQAQQQLPSLIEFESWQVPWENSRPRDPALDSAGNVWFCGQTGNYIARLNPTSGEFTRYEVRDGTNPHNLVVDNNDQVWYAGNRNAHIGRLNPETGDIAEYPMPDEAAQDPHTLVLDAKQNIWFTVQWGNFIGYLDTTSKAVQLYPVPTANARPYGIKLDGQDQPWIVLLGSNKLATIQNNELTEIALPRQQARPRRLEIGDDGRIWYSDYAGGYLGSYNPKTAEFAEWLLPSGVKPYPYATALDSEGRIWVSDTSDIPNQLYGFDTAEEQFVSHTEVEFGGHIRHTYAVPDSNTFWFGTDSGYIARARVKQ